MQKQFLRSLFFVSAVANLAGCAEDTTDTRIQLSFSDTAVQALVASRPSTVRIWYTYTGLSDSAGKNSNLVQPASAVPNDVSTGENTSAKEWSTSKGEGTGFTVGALDKITLNSLPLGKSGTEFAIEILQTLSDQKIHPVAFYVFSGGPEPLSEAQLKATLALGGTLIAGRSCGSASKAQQFSPPFTTDAAFVAACP